MSASCPHCLRAFPGQAPGLWLQLCSPWQGFTIIKPLLFLITVSAE